MSSLILLIVSVLTLTAGSVLGYYARQSIAKKQFGTLEERFQKRVSQAKKESEEILAEAKEKSSRIFEKTKRETEQGQREVLRGEQLLSRRETTLAEKFLVLDEKEKEFQEKVQKLKKIKESLEGLREKALENLERTSKLSKDEAKEELLQRIEKDYENDILERIRKLEREGEDRFEEKAKEILATAIQRCTISQAQDLTTATISLPSDDLKGKIIGKEGRNIKTLEKLTGVEIIVDDTPEAVVISAFDPVRRQIAKLALEKLIADGRIQPARIEEQVQKAEIEISKKIKEAGENAAYETGIAGLPPQIIQLLGRLNFRTSFGQNVLLHSIEVSYLAATLASELGANPAIAKKAGLLHDIGKAIDHQVQGSHANIGIKILEKFGQDREVINAMKSHHEEYPYETLESIIVQVADQISGARPGARKDTVENYLKRLAELEGTALSFPGIEKAWALQAGREIRVFVKPEEIDDLGAKKLAREIAEKIQTDLRYPGEIKVNVIRETRVTEYAR